MIYLITGVPGSGKSLYAVSTLLRKLMAETITAEDGKTYARRLVVDGIPDLLLPHEMTAPGRKVVDRDSNASVMQAGEEGGDGVWNWFEWVKPGDVLVIDEAQRWWRPRGMGTKVPQMVAELETHRHHGIDVVLITQSPMLLDQNVRRLVGRHIHVRRLFGGKRAILYDWDGCQSDTSRLSGASKSLWSYPRDGFGQYKSSELHTKQRQKVPLWLALPFIAAIGLLFVAPKAYSVLTLKDKSAAAVAPAVPARPAAALPASAPAPAKAPGPIAAASKPLRLMGCMHFRDRCQCFDADGRAAETESAFCADASERTSALPLLAARGGGPAAPAKAPQDCDWIIAMGSGAAEYRCGPSGAVAAAVPSQQSGGVQPNAGLSSERAGGDSTDVPPVHSRPVQGRGPDRAPAQPGPVGPRP